MVHPHEIDMCEISTYIKYLNKRLEVGERMSSVIHEKFDEKTLIMTNKYRKFEHLNNQRNERDLDEKQEGHNFPELIIFYG